MSRLSFSALGAALILASATASAQAPAARHDRGHEGHEMRGERGKGRGEMALFRGIDLSAAQKEQVKQIREKYRAQMKEQRHARRGEEADRRRPTPEEMEAMRKVRQQQVSEIRAVLTAEQQVKFDANLAEATARMKERAQHRR